MGFMTQTNYEMIHNLCGFVKHDLKGSVEVYRVEIWTHGPRPPPYTRDRNLSEKPSFSSRPLTDVTETRAKIRLHPAPPQA
jgi:hypothetical protein